jgi:hypothetical protein
VPQQSARFESDAWEEPIAAYVSTLERTTIASVATNCLGFKMARVGTADQRRIAGVLTALGWERRRSGQNRWWLRRGDASDAL